MIIATAMIKTETKELSKGFILVLKYPVRSLEKKTAATGK